MEDFPSPLRPPIRAIPKPPNQHRHMKMLPLLRLPHHKLDLNLREKRLHPAALEVFLRIERQTPALVARLVE
jgi:hypothetical protein